MPNIPKWNAGLKVCLFLQPEKLANPKRSQISETSGGINGTRPCLPQKNVSCITSTLIRGYHHVYSSRMMKPSKKTISQKLFNLFASQKNIDSISTGVHRTRAIRSERDGTHPSEVGCHLSTLLLIHSSDWSIEGAPSEVEGESTAFFYRFCGKGKERRFWMNVFFLPIFFWGGGKRNFEPGLSGQFFFVNVCWDLIWMCLWSYEFVRKVLISH